MPVVIDHQLISEYDSFTPFLEFKDKLRNMMILAKYSKFPHGEQIT